MAIALIVETGPGVSGANTYISVADADLYQANRGRSSWAALTDDAKAIALITATEAIDSLYPWIGKRKTATQGLKWPRIEGKTPDGIEIQLSDSDGFGIDGVPQAVINACAEGAFLMLSEEIFQNDDAHGKIIRKKTDVLETEFQPDSPTSKPTMPTIFGSLNAILKGLYVVPSNGMKIGKAVRA